MADETLATLQRIESKLAALLAIAVHEQLRNDPELAKPRPRAIDVLLSDSGLSSAEIAAVLGKTRRAVDLVLAKERK